MFVDLEGSVPLLAELGPEAYNHALRAFHNLVTVHVRMYDGEVAQYLGDGVMCFFHRGRGELGRAAAAIAAGWQIIAALQKPGEEQFNSVRIGIASGLALFNDEETAAGARVVGTCINLAARLQNEADPGTILVCDESKRSAAGHFSFDALPDRGLKGFPGKTTIWRVQAPKARSQQSPFDLPAPRAARLPIVGREADLSRLQRALSETIAGRGQSVAIIGEGGLGKTRLVQEFLRRSSAESCAKLILSCSRDEASRDFHPIKAYLHWIVGVAPGDDDQKRAAKLSKLFSAIWGLAPEEITDLLLLLGAHPDRDARMSGNPVVLRGWLYRQLITRLIEIRGTRPALIVVLEDIHWLDPSSGEFLAELDQQLARERILLVFTQRTVGPDDRPARHADRVLRLTPLSTPQSTEMIRAILGDDLADQGALSWVRDKARGVPLFVSAFADFARRQSGPDFSGTSLPLDLLDLFEQSLSRLPGPTRRFVQAAAVMGSIFEPELIAALLDESPEAMADHIALLAKEQLVGERTNGSGLSFAHDLIREAIYGNLSKDLRRRLHGDLADLMLAQWPEAPSHLLALHYERAQRPGEAITHLLAASLSAVRVGALQAATGYLGTAFDLIGQLGSHEERLHQELILRSTEGPLQMILGGPGSQAFGAAQRRSMELMHELGLKSERAHLLYNSGLHDWARLRLAAARDLSQDILALSGEGEEAQLAGHTLAGLVAWHQGDNAAAGDHLHQAVALYRIEAHAAMFQKYMKDFGVFSLFYAGLTASVRGDFAAAQGFADRAQQTSETLAIPHAMGFGLLAQFMTALMRGDTAAARHYSLLGETLARTHRFPEFQAMSVFTQGWADSRDPATHAQGVARMLDGLAGWQNTGFLAWQSLFESLLIEELVQAGRLTEAQGHLGHLKQRIAQSGELQFLAPALVAEARLLAAHHQTDAARQCLALAMTHARERQALLWLGKAEGAMAGIGGIGGGGG